MGKRIIYSILISVFIITLMPIYLYAWISWMFTWYFWVKLLEKNDKFKKFLIKIHRFIDKFNK